MTRYAHKVAGASDATYHVMWVILFNAVDDFGIREVNEQVRMGAAMQTISGSTINQQFEQIETVKHKLLEEALRLPAGALAPFFDEARGKGLQHRAKVVKYPIPEDSSSNQGVGPHFDGEFLTFVSICSPSST